MSSRNHMSTEKAMLLTFGTILVILFILAALGVGDGPKCAHSGCDRDAAYEGDYCYLHSSSGYSSSHKTSTNHSSSYGTSSSGSATGSSTTSSSGTTTSHKTGSTTSSSISHKTSKHDTYDDGYDDVYMDDDYDWDRYMEDDDYASGVDDAIEDMEDEGEDW